MSLILEHVNNTYVYDTDDWYVQSNHNKCSYRVILNKSRFDRVNSLTSMQDSIHEKDINWVE